MSTKNKASSASLSDPKSIGDHLGELRRRLTWVVLTVILMSALAYSVHDLLVSFVLSPIGDQKLVYLTPGGGFTFIFQIILYAGLLLSAPVAIYHIYRFVAPALPASVSGKGLRVVVVSALLMLAGAAFGYFVAVPAALQFLTAFAGDFVQANLTADSYLNFLVAYVLGLGLMFQLPLFLIAWNWINPIPPGGLLSSQRFVIVGAFIAAALLTPTPDVFNQSLLAVPIIAVYQFGVISVYTMNRKRRHARHTPAKTQEVEQRYNKPVFDTALLTATTHHAKPQPSHKKPRPIHVTSKPVKPPVATQASTAAVDGFVRHRPAAVAIPHRTSSAFRPTLTRAAATRPTLAGVRRPQTNIDGFTFR